MASPDAADTPPPGAVTIVRRQFSVGGFGYGMRQEFLRAIVRIDVPSGTDWTPVDAALAAIIPSSGAADQLPTTPADRLMYWTAELQRAGGQLVFDRGRVLGAQPQTGAVTMAIPTFDAEPASEALQIVVNLVSGLIDGALAAEDVLEDARARAAKFIERYAAVRIGGSNTPHFFRAAFENRMPLFRLTQEVCQIGMGARARWLDSSLTDATGAIAMRLARNKVAAADFLRQCGLPVAVHAVVRSADEAEAAAVRIGYPAVVKPVDMDGGVAVAAGLTTAEQVRDAYEAARKVSANVMIEKHVDGRDYRLVVHNGRMIWALERVPGGVTGDGVSTVAQLIERLNQEPSRAKRADAPLKPLVFDREAGELLAECGMTLDSVPGAGERVRLRRAANVASGGTPEAVFDRVHPDNARLAERAASVMRLDLAGIDLLIPDISLSWRETVAAICEVNAQPTIGNTTSKHLYSQLLKSLVQGEGRMPIAVVAGAGAESPVPALVARILQAAGLRTAVASAREATNGGRLLHGRPRHVFDAARAALVDPETDALVVGISDASALTTGVPFDRCTTIVLAGTDFGNASADDTIVQAIARLLVPVSLGGVVADARAAAWQPTIGRLRNAKIVLSSADAQQAAIRDHAAAGGDTVIAEIEGDRCRLVLAGQSVALAGPENGDALPLACTPEDMALAAAAARSIGCDPEMIRRGLSGVRLTLKAEVA